MSATRERVARLLAEGRTVAQIAREQGRALPLALHHVNGDRDDNRLENLELLCPNCHALTASFSGRNRGAYLADAEAA